jgi:hypothetical protein
MDVVRSSETAETVYHTTRRLVPEDGALHSNCSVGVWWTKRHWGRFSPSTSVSPANHSTNFSIIIITRGWRNRPLSGRSVEWTLIPPPTTQIKKNCSVNLKSTVPLGICNVECVTAVNCTESRAWRNFFILNERKASWHYVFHYCYCLMYNMLIFININLYNCNCDYLYSFCVVCPLFCV